MSLRHSKQTARKTTASNRRSTEHTAPSRISIIPRASIPPKPARRAKAQAKVVADKIRPKRPAAVSPATVVHRARTKRSDLQRTDDLLTLYTPLVRQIVGGFQRKLPSNVLREDLLAAGMSGLWDAIRRHEGKPADSFEWYVRVRIRGAILDELRAQDWLPRRVRALANKGGDGNRATPSVVRFDDVSPAEQSRSLLSAAVPDSESAVEAKFARENLARAVDQLPERERHIVSAHYFRGVKFKELGDELGVSEPRISQLHSRAMVMLKAIITEAA